MSTEKFFIPIIVLFMLLLTLTAAVQAQSIIEPVENNPNIGLGRYSTSGNTFFGDFKSCSTDAFFYFIISNNSTESVTVTLPRRLFMDDRYFYIDVDAYQYKKLPSGWSGANFADARNGTPLILNNNTSLILPQKTAYSVMGRVKGLSHELSKRKINPGDVLNAEVTILFDNMAILASGDFKEEGSICSSIQVLPFEGENYVSGSYLIDQGTDTTCSLGYYFKVLNQDSRYATTVELPRWVEMNEYRWDIGCKYIYDGCLISGFRHYAYAEQEPNVAYEDLDFTFCDQDREKGDKCYEENGLWWLNVPAGKTYVIRGMVNDLCSDEEGQENPLRSNKVDIRFFVADSGSNKWWADGTIIGRNSGANAAKALTFISRLEDRDPDFYLSQKNIEEVIEIQKNKKNKTVSPVTTDKSAIVSKDPAGAPQPEYGISLFPVPSFWQHDYDKRSMNFPATGFPATMAVRLNEQPSEMMYQDLGAYTLSIPASGVTSKIVGIPLDESSDSWAVEWLNERAGLLAGSALPGKGISVLAGHNHLNNTAAGPFAALSNLLTDDRIFVTTPAGELLQYRIYENGLFKSDEFQLCSEHLKKDALVLITCENETIEGGYQNRRVVFAEPV